MPNENIKTEKSNFQDIMFYPEKNVLHVVWKNTEELTNNLYKTEIFWQLEKILYYQPAKMLIDTQQMFFTILPEIQDWSNTEVMPQVMASKVQKIALLIAKDLFVQVSIEQQIEDHTEFKQLIRYFENEAQAFEWLEK